MLHYIIQVIAFQLFFLIIYDVLLKKETFFNWNRFYLIATAALSVLLPFIKIAGFKDIVPKQYVIKLPEIFIGSKPQLNANQTQIENISIQAQSNAPWEFLFYAGMVIATCLLVFKIGKIIWLLSQNPKSKLGRLHIIKLINSTSAFSFFNYIFLGECLSETDKDSILKHELIHVQHKHSVDLLFFEALRIVFWFNPLIYMYQNRMVELHEFIADSEAIKNQCKADYYQNLLSHVFETQNISFINPFFKQSLIKKRIVMLQKSKSKQINLLKYILLVPLVFGMLVYTSSYGQEKDKIELNKSQDLEQYTYRVVVRDVRDEQLMLKAKELNQGYEAFLIENPEYVGWAQGDFKSGMTYSIHSIEEKVPENLTRTAVAFPDGSSYVMYIDFGKPPSPPPATESEEDKKQKEEELIKLKQDVFDDVEVPFSYIEHVPVFPGCESLTTNDAKKDCFSDHISDYVSKNFNTKIGKENNLTGIQRINVIFKIDKQGNITNVKARAPHLALEAEAIRVINSLPKMIPGEQKDKKVVVPYSLPIIFKVADDKVIKEDN